MRLFMTQASTIRRYNLVVTNIFGIPLFVLDVSLILTAIVAAGLSVAVFILFRRQKEQRILNEKMEKTIDRILKIEDGAGGGIDGWEMALQERKRAENRKR